MVWKIKSRLKDLRVMMNYITSLCGEKKGKLRSECPDKRGKRCHYLKKE